MRGTCVCVILSGLTLAATGAAEPKPLVNADFETVDRNGKPLGWELPPETGWSIADGQGINGMHALCYDGDLGMTKRGIPLQWVEIDRSKRYLMEAYVRTVGLGGGGASICIQCHDKDGNVFYGKYSHDAIVGDSDGWVRISDVTHAGQFPPTAVKLSLCLFVKGTPRGKAYFDNVRLIPYDEAKAKVAGLVSDVYRATAASGKVTFHAALNLTEKEFADRKPVAYCRFIDASGAKAVRKVTALTRSEASFALDVGELAEGTHPVEFALAGADGERIGVARLDFTRTAEPVKRKVEIDRYNRVIVDGKPFFPLGMYVNHIDNANETNLDIYCQAPFNCVLPYALPQSRAHLDLCQRRNLKVIASIYHVWAGTRSAWVKTEDDEKPFLRKVVADIADHPAVLAWYESDELPAAMIPRMAERIRFMAEIDPDHPVYACICLVDEVRDFLPGFDVVGSDPYPIGRSDVKRTPLSLAAEWTRQTRRQSFGCRSMWQIPQAFDWSWYIKTDDPRFPTAEEFRNIGYQCIAEGANGLIWFHFSAMLQQDPKFAEHWASVCATVRELARYQDVFASVPGPAAEETDVMRFSVRTWRKDGSVWALAVNNTREPLVAKAVLAEPVGAVAETAFGPAPSAHGRELVFDLPALGCALVRLEGR